MIGNELGERRERGQRREGGEKEREREGEKRPKRTRDAHNLNIFLTGFCYLDSCLYKRSIL